MAETTITVSKRVAERLHAIVRERGHTDDLKLADDAITHQLEIDDAWHAEILRHLDIPEDQRRYVPHEDTGAWLTSLGIENKLPRPEGKPLRDVLNGHRLEC